MFVKVNLRSNGPWTEIIQCFFCYVEVIVIAGTILDINSLYDPTYTSEFCLRGLDCFVTALGLIQYFSTQGEAAKCL